MAAVKSLLKVNPNLVSCKDIDGNTPLYYAMLMGHKDVVKLLRQHGGHE